MATALQHNALGLQGFNLGQHIARQAPDKRSIPTDEPGGYYRASSYHYPISNERQLVIPAVSTHPGFRFAAGEAEIQNELPKTSWIPGQVRNDEAKGPKM